jgi:membrane-associated phospholipid phosphatase
LYFSHSRKDDRNDELFWTAAISLAITGVLSGIFPAAGALHHFRIGLEHAVHLHDFFALRDRTVTTFALSHMEGIVTFPSFHTVCAILLMYVFRGTRIFIPVVWLNALLLLSTPIFGGHYLVDMVGGGVVALLAIYAANFARARLEKTVTRDANTSGSRAHAAETL